nr:TetR family transcriptional regulator [Chromobacterium haemolyticum]
MDAAEDIIERSGAAALTIDAVAKAVGISKGGVQSCFGAKHNLVNAMLERWGKHYDACFEQTAGVGADQLSSIEQVKVHVRITAREEALIARAACHLSAMLESKDQKEWVRAWHAERLGKLDASTEEGRRARMAYLAVEGAFMLRYFGLADMSEQEWQDAFHDIEQWAGS